MNTLYPLKFRPLLKELIWGGGRITRFKGLPERAGIGESWEISGVEGSVSVVANGPLRGRALDDLIGEHKSELVGRHGYGLFGTVFPLLVKFIDCNRDVSVQVHPNDEIAKARHNSFGKTEMWYIIEAGPGASVLSGFARQMTPEAYDRAVRDHDFIAYLKEHEIRPGDVFLMPSGRVHAARAGTFFCEIQQTSDITYRIYDYGRTGPDGKKRELHTDLAKGAIDYTVLDDYRTKYAKEPNRPVLLESTKYFTVRLLDLTEKIVRDFSMADSFVVYVCTEGACRISDKTGRTVAVRQGESLLVPAATAETVYVEPVGKATLLETHI